MRRLGIRLRKVTEVVDGHDGPSTASQRLASLRRSVPARN